MVSMALIQQLREQESMDEDTGLAIGNASLLAGVR